MQAIKYYNQVMNQTAETLLSIPILSRIDSLTTKQLHYLFSQIYYFVEKFPGFMGLIIWQTNNEGVRFSLIDNLVDECGGFEKIRNRDYSATHSGMLKTFVEKLDLENSSLAEISCNTKIMLSDFNKLFIHSTFIEALSALASMEGVSTRWFDLIYRQIKQRQEFSEEELYFFKLHTIMDEMHGDILKETLIPYLISKENYALFRNGAINSVTIWKNFYQAITEEMDLCKEFSNIELVAAG